MKVKVSSFEKRNDIGIFRHLAKHDDPYNYMLANFVEDIHVSSWGFSDEPYKRMMKVKVSIHYTFQQDMKNVENILEALSVNNSSNEIIVKYMSGVISPETVCILHKIFDIVPYWKKHMSSIVYEDILTMIENYEPFLEYDLKKCKDFLIKHYK
ncbi:MAG: hypothetical protein COA52_00345 [Hyphomicrobiales bacterium]|nr:MAG: hypothetical protein COA52_00345 [Hyphomicrobiales bacterium]